MWKITFHRLQFVPRAWNGSLTWHTLLSEREQIPSSKGAMPEPWKEIKEIITIHFIACLYNVNLLSRYSTSLSWYDIIYLISSIKLLCISKVKIHNVKYGRKIWNLSKNYLMKKAERNGLVVFFFIRFNNAAYIFGKLSLTFSVGNSSYNLWISFYE